MKYSEKNKPLVCMQTNSTCYINTKPMEIKGVLIHSTAANNKTLKRYVQPSEGASDYDAVIKLLGKNVNGNDWNHIYREAGLNAWIGELADGTVTTVQTMPWDYRPWGCGSGSKGSCNDGWIQFECCEDNLTDKKYFEAVYKEACELIAYLCTTYKLDPKGTVTYNGIKVPVILCHKDSYDLKVGSNHGDVLHWFPKFGKDMDDLRNDVYNLMHPVSAPAAPSAPTSSFKEGDEVKVKAGSLWSNGKTPSSWVYDSKMYIRSAVSPEGTVKISTLKTGDISGTINVSCLEPYSQNTTTDKPAAAPTPTPSAPTTPSSGKFKEGDAVRVIKGATWTNGKTPSSWVFDSKMYVRDVNSDGNIRISTQKTGDISGTINPKYLTAYVDTTTSAPSFTSYIVQITASSLNVRAGAGASYKVNTIVHSGEKYTIVEEQNGWGKLKSGAGWINLSYAKKV